MGLEVPRESLLALANRPDSHVDCELIHMGVTTRVVQVLAAPAPRSVGHQPPAAVFPSRTLFLEPSEDQRADWSL